MTATFHPVSLATRNPRMVLRPFWRKKGRPNVAYMLWFWSAGDRRGGGDDAGAGAGRPRKIGSEPINLLHRRPPKSRSSRIFASRRPTPTVAKSWRTSRKGVDKVLSQNETFRFVVEPGLFAEIEDEERRLQPPGRVSATTLLLAPWIMLSSFRAQASSARCFSPS